MLDDDERSGFWRDSVNNDQKRGQKKSEARERLGFFYRKKFNYDG